MTEKFHVYYSEDYKQHDTGVHPECAARMDAVVDSLKKKDRGRFLQWCKPRHASRDEVELVHPLEYFQFIESLSRSGGGMADADTVVSAASFETACLSAGAALQAVDDVCTGKGRYAMTVSRPPGHHATSSQAMGFCIFNNIAIAARYAQKRYGIKQVLILDWDVHHGNGTQDIFYEDNTVFYVSTHQHPHYPGTGLAEETGKGIGEGYTRNVPFPPFAEADRIVQGVQETLQEILATFAPDLMLVSAGFDGHRDDPLGNWLLQEEHYCELAQITKQIADRHCQGRHIACLEGGYHLKALGESCAAYCSEFQGAA